MSVSASEPEYVSVSVAETKRDPFDRVKPSWCHYSSDKHFLSLNLSFLHNRTTQQRQIYNSIPKTHPVEIGVAVNNFPGAFGLFCGKVFWASSLLYPCVLFIGKDKQIHNTFLCSQILSKILSETDI